MSFLKKILPVNVKNISVNLNMYLFIYFLRMKNRIAFLLYFRYVFEEHEHTVPLSCSKVQNNFVVIYFLLPSKVTIHEFS